MSKQLALHWLRRTRLLPIAEHIRFLCHRRKGANLPASAYDAFGHLDWNRYVSEAKPAAEYLAELIGNKRKVLEWGCGPGRVIRHLPALLPHAEIHGIDYSRESIDWCRKNIPGVSFSTNRLMPPTDFADRTFDAIYSVSVFTHLSLEAHHAWIAELRRILIPGGLLVFTTHGRASTDRLLAHELARFNTGELVVRDGVSEGSRCFLAYHPEEFVRSMLSGFEVEHHPAPNRLSHFQDLWIAHQ